MLDGLAVQRPELTISGREAVKKDFSLPGVVHSVDREARSSSWFSRRLSGAIRRAQHGCCGYRCWVPGTSQRGPPGCGGSLGAVGRGSSFPAGEALTARRLGVTWLQGSGNWSYIICPARIAVWPCTVSHRTPPPQVYPNRSPGRDSGTVQPGRVVGPVMCRCRRLGAADSLRRPSELAVGHSNGPESSRMWTVQVNGDPTAPVSISLPGSRDDGAETREAQKQDLGREAEQDKQDSCLEPVSTSH